MKEDMAIGLLDIAVEILNLLAAVGQDLGKIDRDGGFSRSAFSAGNGYSHGVSK
jgi:hypothetical protein